MDAVDFSLLSLISVCIILLMVGYFAHNRDIVNPISAFVVMELTVTGILSAASSWYVFNVFDVTEALLSDAIWIHLIYGLAVVVGYFCEPIHIPLKRLINFIYSNSIVLGAKRGVRITLIFGAVLAMLMLVLSGSDGIHWLTDPRYAYINLRAGYGQWWVLYQICIVLLLIRTLFGIDGVKNSYNKVGRSIVLFSGLMYFTGSKSAVLIVVIISFFYVHHTIRRLKIFELFALVFLVFVGFLILLGEGSYADIFNGFLRYFSDYVAVTALNIDQINIQGYTLGSASLSSLWYWVPRSLMIDKPFEWGTTYLHGILFPGMAEQGHTPGALLWITYYMDFGVIGVIVYGVFLGAFSRVVYYNFMLRRDASSFLLMIPFCFFIVPVSAGSSSLFIIMTLFLIIFDRGREFRMLSSGKLISKN